MITFRDLSPKTKGEYSEQMIITALMRQGWHIAKPIGDNSRIDLLIWKDDGSPVLRVQCKTAKPLAETGFVFPVHSRRLNTKGSYNADYRGLIDVFGVYQPELEKCYLVPIDICGLDCKLLRTKKSRQSNSDYAEDYEIKPSW